MVYSIRRMLLWSDWISRLFCCFSSYLFGCCFGELFFKNQKTDPGKSYFRVAVKLKCNWNFYLRCLIWECYFCDYDLRVLENSLEFLNWYCFLFLLLNVYEFHWFLRYRVGNGDTQDGVDEWRNVAFQNNIATEKQPIREDHSRSANQRRPRIVSIV